jgi:hypothetical protein
MKVRFPIGNWLISNFFYFKFFCKHFRRMNRNHVWFIIGSKKF